MERTDATSGRDERVGEPVRPAGDDAGRAAGKRASAGGKAGAGKGARHSVVKASDPALKGYPESVQQLIAEFTRLPGIGRRSAERLAFHVLKSTREEALGLADAVREVKRTVTHCRVCYNLMDRERPAASRQMGGHDPQDDVCDICGSAERDRGLVMVVEQPRDLIALEQTGMYKGVYHVLMGRISPLDGVTAGDLTVHDLLERVRDASRNAGGVPVREVVLALNPTMESEGTGLYLGDELGKMAKGKGGAGVKVTRLARGLPTGMQLEFANKAVLADAIEGRKPM